MPVWFYKSIDNFDCLLLFKQLTIRRIFYEPNEYLFLIDIYFFIIKKVYILIDQF